MLKIFSPLAVLFGLMITFSVNAADTKQVEVSGVGETLSAAKADAVRQAVEKVVKSYVSSDLIISNDDVIRDKVISYSNGFVEKVAVVNQSRRSDGLFEVKVIATVSTRKVIRKLEDENIAVTELESESMFAQATSSMNTENSFRELLSTTAHKFPVSAFKAEVLGQPTVEAAYSGVKVSFVLQTLWDDEYKKSLIEFFKIVGESPLVGPACNFEVFGKCYVLNESLDNWENIHRVWDAFSKGYYLIAVTISDKSGNIVRKYKTDCIDSPHVGKRTTSSENYLFFLEKPEYEKNSKSFIQHNLWTTREHWKRKFSMFVDRDEVLKFHKIETKLFSCVYDKNKGGGYFGVSETDSYETMGEGEPL